MPTPKKRAAPLAEPRLSLKQKKALLQYLIRDEMVFLAAQKTFSSQEWGSVFPPRYGGWAVVLYDTLRRQYDKTGTMPGKKLLESLLEDSCSVSPGLVSREQKRLFFRWARRASSRKPLRSAERQLALSYVRRLKQEQIKSATLTWMREDQRQIEVTEYLQNALEDLQKAKMVESQEDFSGKVFGENWDLEVAVPLRPTGCAALDELLTGGDREGEVNLFMGPYASCKTLLAIQCTCASIDTMIAEEAAGRFKSKSPMTVLVSYETEKTEFEIRCICYMAKIPFHRMNAIKSIRELKRPGDELQEYEKKLFARKLELGQPVKTELERFLLAKKKAEKYIRFIDFSGGHDAGSQGVPEIVARLEVLRKEEKAKTGKWPVFWAVWIDHLDAMVDNMLNEGSLRPDQKRLVLKSTPLHLRRKIAAKYHTRVWLLHQLSAETNARHPAARIHHTDSAECRAVAQYCAQAVVTGNKDSNDLCVWRITKKRRVAPPRDELIIKIDGEFSCVTNVSDRYLVDTEGRAIVEKVSTPPQRKSRSQIVLSTQPSTATAAPVSEPDGDSETLRQGLYG